MKCEKCERDITEQWENNITYKGEEEHHNPPQFMLDNWRGTLHNLCVDCHDDLHKEIIKILNKILGTLKFCNSEYWVWRKMSQQQKAQSINETTKFTNEWLETK